jgi:hypothetical protein
MSGQITLPTDWPLSAALAAAAVRSGIDATRADGPTVLAAGHHGWALPTPDEAATVGIRLALTRIAASLSARPTRATGTLLAPAAGWCGPSSAGPVDALRIEGRHHGSSTDDDLDWDVWVFTTAQTRCWMLHATFTDLTGPACADTQLEVLPEEVRQDTARATQFQLDRGHGAWWPEVVLLADPVLTEGRLDVVALYTDGLVAGTLLEQVGLCEGAER